MNTNGQDAGKSRKLKTIIVSIIAAAVIILVAFWAISSVMGGAKKVDNGKKTTETSREEKKKEEPVAQTGTDPVSPSQQYNPVPETQTPAAQTPATQTPAPVATTKQNDIPTTGASEVIFSAIMLGVVASLAVLNLQLIKEQRNQ